MASVAFIVIVEKAAGIRAADFGVLGKSDPFCRISSPTAPAVFNEETHVIKDNLNPEWNTSFLVVLPASVPAVISVDVFDSDAGRLVDGSNVRVRPV